MNLVHVFSDYNPRLLILDYHREKMAVDALPSSQISLRIASGAIPSSQSRIAQYQQRCQKYRPAKALPFELREHITVSLEEELCTFRISYHY